MEVIVSEGTSDVYRDFVDFRQMAAQMEMMCNHDHALNQSMQGNDMLAGFMDSHKNDGHNHGDSLRGKHDHKDNDEYEVDPKTGKKSKKKKKYSWFGLVLK